MSRREVRFNSHNSPPPPRTPLVAFAFFALAAGVVTWLGGRREVTFPVSGRLVVNEMPAVGARLAFYRIGARGIGPERPEGTVNADGMFELQTRWPGDGAPIGEYAVTIDWKRTIDAGGETATGTSLLPPEYGRRTTTPLRARVVEGINRLPDFRINTDACGNDSRSRGVRR